MTYLTLVSLSPMALPAFLDRDPGTLNDPLKLPMSIIDITRVSLCECDKLELTWSYSRPPSHLPPLSARESDFVHYVCSWRVKVVEPLCVTA